MARDSQQRTDDEQQIEVIGTVSEPIGQYGEVAAEAGLRVEIDGKEIVVPWTGIKLGGIDYYGDVPNDLDMDRLMLVDGRVHAEADVGDGAIVELIPDYNAATSEFRGYERWEAQQFDDPIEGDGTVVYEREEVEA